ncbi:hypothetical protein LTR64_008423 [Lithohypha guttulata]|uniref:uncharacterized protein n=1 Tax=Lithohypha guttulata TaxID=1690604 RepID=UPI002DDEB987|nr:hypothetical protein LTR51_008532 [Lithohypha guttulata]
MSPSSTWLRQLLTKPIRNGVVAFAAFLSLILLLQLFRNPALIGSRSGGQRWRAGVTVSAARQRSLNDVRNSTLGFERIVAINLRERTDHRDGLVLQTAVSDIKVDFINGVSRSSIQSKVLPTGHRHDEVPPWIGTWRAHMNAISHVVEKNWTSALILEDDVDWDIRLKSLLQDFALSTDDLLRHRDQGRRALSTVDTSHVPSSSPFGDGWDVLWLGHCGMELPIDDQNSVILHYDDLSVPQVEYQKSYDIKAESPLRSLPSHTRAVAYGARQGTCSLAYAVSRTGARRILNDLGLERLDDAFDLSLRDWCEGNNGHQRHTCISVLPQLFDHYRPAGSNIGDSEINPEDDQHTDRAYTRNIRWSVRLNIDKLLSGDKDFDDQYPDV